jgi:hypothetical protein
MEDITIGSIWMSKLADSSCYKVEAVVGPDWVKCVPFPQSAQAKKDKQSMTCHIGAFVQMHTCLARGRKALLYRMHGFIPGRSGGVQL